MDIKDIKVGKWYNVPFKVVEIKSGDIHMENGGIKAVCQPSELSEISTRQDVRSEHSTVGTLSAAERLDRLWNGMWDVLFGEASLRYAADAFNAMQNHIKSITPDPENGIKNTENAPKYDSNRKFRKGDKVRLREYNGRKPYDFWHKQTIEHFGSKLDTVLEDELDSGNVDTFQDAPIDELTVRVHASHLELVTPVEELEPYFISEGAGIIELYKGTTDEVVKAWFYDAVKAGVEALAAAEAERDRLNAEYRKEQSNG